jgi:hypothetical protein
MVYKYVQKSKSPDISQSGTLGDEGATMDCPGAVQVSSKNERMKDPQQLSNDHVE